MGEIVLHRNSIDHHRAVHLVHNIVSGPRVARSVTYENVGNLASTSWRIERNIFEIVLGKVKQVSAGTLIVQSRNNEHTSARGPNVE